MDRIGFFGNTKSVAMEVHHLERSIPGLKSFSKNLNFGDKGLTTIENKSTFDEMYLFNDPKNWTEVHREKFYSECTRMIDANYVNDGFFEKYS